MPIDERFCEFIAVWLGAGRDPLRLIGSRHGTSRIATILRGTAVARCNRARRKRRRELAASRTQEYSEEVSPPMRRPLAQSSTIGAVQESLPRESDRNPLAAAPTLESINELKRSNDRHTSEGPSSLETFLRDFLVEQTGYPHDMIQLDWDLEADLGIDSIKLTQLMGELREMFEVDPAALMAQNVRT